MSPARIPRSSWRVLCARSDARADPATLDSCAAQGTLVHVDAPLHRLSLCESGVTVASYAVSLGSGGTAAGLVGDYDTVARRIVDFHRAGVELFMLQFQPFEADMRSFAQEVVPRVRRLLD